MKKETKIKGGITIKDRSEALTTEEFDEILTMDMTPYKKLFKEWKDRGINDHFPKEEIKKESENKNPCQ